MQKAELIKNITEKTGIPTVDVLITLESFFKEVKTSIKAGEPVHLRGFGSFISKHRNEKPARNIKAGENITVPAHNAPIFKPSQEFKDAVKKAI